MSRGVNKCILIGNLGADPETKYMPSGAAVANMRLAVGERFKNRETGETQERTEWVTVVAFGKLAEVCGEYLKKGSQAFFEGRLRTRKWQDKQGQDRYSTEVVADNLVMLGGGQRGEARAERPNRPAPERPAEAATASDLDDDIPF